MSGMTLAEFKNVLLSKGESMMINSGNIIRESQVSFLKPFKKIIFLPDF